MIGCPKEGASDSRRCGARRCRHTRSPKCSRTSSTTCSASLCPGVVHGQDDGAHLELGVEVGLHQPDVAQQLAQPLQGVVLALDRHDDLSGRRPGR